MPRHVFAAHVLISVINHRLGNLECLGAEPEALADGAISGIFNTMKWSLHNMREIVPGNLKFDINLVALRPWLDTRASSKDVIVARILIASICIP